MPSLALLKILGKNLDEWNIDCGIFVDLKKALDTVKHEILLPNFEHYSVHGLADK